jgi:hypothetical protein
MFRICLDKPGLCRATFEGFIFKKRKEEYLPADKKYQFMIDAKTECFNEEAYPF